VIRRLRGVAINFLVPALLSWAGIELAGQLYFGNPYNYRAYRFTFDSPDSVVNRGPALWTHRANSEIAETIVYKKPFGGYFVGSSCTYRTDEFGFVDNENGPRDYDLLLLGDSFTAGSAGCAWTDELRRRLPNVTIYNAGLPGTGLPNWAAAEAFLHDRGFRFAHVALLFIADDFFRPAANLAAPDLACLHDITQCTPRNYAYPMVPGIDLAEVSAQRDRTGLGDEIEHFWKRHLWVSFYLLEAVYSRLLSQQRPTVDEATTVALDRLQMAAPDLHLVHVSMKEEAAFGADNARSIAVAEHLGRRGRAADRCALRYGDFFSYDAHPTRAGYVHLAECVAGIVAPVVSPAGRF
jgi:hypothetical protein